jgi:hypothetical protein
MYICNESSARKLRTGHDAVSRDRFNIQIQGMLDTIQLRNFRLSICYLNM